jgi:malonate-semialdehyde dehydrogenase (acetylating)/methylmalonate-semialdehyde dehydrogenase
MPATKASPAVKTETVPVLSGGNWNKSGAARHADVYNPSTGRVIAHVPLCSAEQVNDVVETSAAALAAWSETPVVERARLMFRFRNLLEKHFDELAALVTREHGKTLAEARAEVNRGIEVVEFACGIPSLIAGDILPNISRSWFRCGCFRSRSLVAIRSS